MKIHLLLLICILSFSCTNPYKVHQNSVSDYQIIPKPESLEIAKGKFLITAKTKISATSDLKNEGLYLFLLILQVMGTSN